MKRTINEHFVLIYCFEIKNLLPVNNFSVFASSVFAVAATFDFFAFAFSFPFIPSYPFSSILSLFCPIVCVLFLVVFVVVEVYRYPKK